MSTRAKRLRAFMCGTDMQEELHVSQSTGVETFSAIKHLKKERPCWRECGIVEVEIREVKWRVKQKL